MPANANEPPTADVAEIAALLADEHLAQVRDVWDGWCNAVNESGAADEELHILHHETDAATLYIAALEAYVAAMTTRALAAEAALRDTDSKLRGYVSHTISDDVRRIMQRRIDANAALLAASADEPTGGE